MTGLLRLRDGQRIAVSEYPKDHLDAMHASIDKIQRRQTFNDRLERFLSRPAVAAVLTIVGAFLIGWAAFHPGVQ
jgi:membrane-bound ClpP family serine protease